VTERNIYVKIIFKSEERIVEMEEGSSVENLLRSLHLYVDAHIITRSNRPLPLTYRLNDGEELTIIQVASGG
jgi:sulfur carrier protein ThiS